MNKFKFILIFVLLPLVGCATDPSDKTSIDYFQPEIISEYAPKRTWGILSSDTIYSGLSLLSPIIPSYKNDGMLLASWNPNPNGVKNRPTIVIIHGGHGLNSTDFATAIWAIKKLDANALVLDSYWSRGKDENWQTWTRYGANMRVLDSIAAARWLVTQGVDKDKIFLMGGSQGGWAVLRTFTKNSFIEDEAKSLFKGGISLYPNCNSKGTLDNPSLSPYWASVIVFTGGRDTATPSSECPSYVFKESYKWIHYPDATHGWDVANRGASSIPVDKECTRAKNVFNQFQICRSNSTTENMQNNIKEFIFGLIQ